MEGGGGVGCWVATGHQNSDSSKRENKISFFTQCQTFISSTSSTFLKSLRVVTVFDIVDQSWHEMDS